MRTTAFDIIKDAAVAAGLPESSVMHTPERDGITLPRPRVEISYLTEQYKPTGKLLKKEFTDESKTYRVVRRERYAITLPVRVVIRAKDEYWLSTFSQAFVEQLPKVTLDPGGNLLTIRLEKAEYGGFTKRTVEVMKKRSKTFHVSITGSSVLDRELPMIRDVNITPNYREETNGQD